MRFLFVLIIFLSSCKHESQKAENSSAEKAYFDLEKVVQDDISSNAKNECSAEKAVTINGSLESKKIDTIDWKNELQTLSDCDINKPSWKGKFDLHVLNDSLKYVYSANSSKIPVRKLTVNYEQKSGDIISIEIERKISTTLFSNEQQIAYFPKKSFKINASQKAIFMKDFNSEVEIRYLCNN